jgi:hypothetical protein
MRIEEGGEDAVSTLGIDRYEGTARPDRIGGTDAFGVMGVGESLMSG